MPFRSPYTFVAAWTLVLAGTPAGAHTLLVSRARVDVHPDRVVANIRVAAEDFLHLYDVVPDRAETFALADLDRAAERHVAALRSAVVWRCGAGRALILRSAERRQRWAATGRVDLDGVRALHAEYDVVWDRPSSADVLFARYRPAGRAARMPSRMALQVRAEAERCREAVQLTSGGNIELVAAQSAAWAGAERHLDLAVDAERDGREVVVRATLPLPMVETWLPCPRARADVLADHEQAAVLDAVRSRFADAIELSGTTAVTVHPLEARLEPLRPAADGLSVWTGHLALRWRWTLADAEAPLRVRWRLFNAAVVVVPMRFADGTVVSFNARSPSVAWPRQP